MTDIETAIKQLELKPGYDVGMGGDAEELTIIAGARFRDRFSTMEALAAERGVDLAEAEPAAVQTLWEDTRS